MKLEANYATIDGIIKGPFSLYELTEIFRKGEFKTIQLYQDFDYKNILKDSKIDVKVNTFNTNEYNDELLENYHYKNHPQMLPFIGNNWGKLKKLLIVGESHYVHNDKNDFEDEYMEIINNWYKLSHKEIRMIIGEKLFNDIISCTNTVKNHLYWICNQNKLKSYNIHQNVSDAVKEVYKISLNKIEPFTYMSFMNFFQRPSQKAGKSIVPNKEDVDIANDVFQDVIEIIKPNFVFIVSSKAWKFFKSNKLNGIIFGHSCHPSSTHWNIKTKGYTKYGSKKMVTGKESFKDFIIVNKIFE